MAASPSSSAFFFLHGPPLPGNPKLHLYLFCPDIGGWHPYQSEITWGQRHIASLGLCADSRSWGFALNIIIDSKTKPQLRILLLCGNGDQLVKWVVGDKDQKSLPWLTLSIWLASVRVGWLKMALLKGVALLEWEWPCWRKYMTGIGLWALRCSSQA